MTDKLFTIRELFDANGGKPVTVQMGQCEPYHIVAITPDGCAIGWRVPLGDPWIEPRIYLDLWRLYTPRRKSLCTKP